MNKNLKYKVLAAVVGLVALAQSTQAVTTASLGDLANGGTLSIGDKTFSGFSWTSTGSDSSIISLLNQQAAQLSVSVFIGQDGVYYLGYSGAVFVNNLLGANSAFGDLKLQYTVTANPGSIVGIDQSYTPNAEPGSGSIVIGETVNIAGGVNVGFSTLSLTDLSDPAPESGDVLTFSPQHQLFVTKDILMIANAGYVVGLSYVQQSYHQTAVPEPSTIVAGALLLLPFGVSTLRILRRGKES